MQAPKCPLTTTTFRLLALSFTASLITGSALTRHAGAQSKKKTLPGGGAAAPAYDRDPALFVACQTCEASNFSFLHERLDGQFALRRNAPRYAQYRSHVAIRFDLSYNWNWKVVSIMNTDPRNVELKAGQVAAVLDLNPKWLQNTVDAGHVRSSATGQGRGSTRLYTFADIVQLRLLAILVDSYGLERGRAARVLAEVWNEQQFRRKQTLVLELLAKPNGGGINLEPIKLPLAQIVKATEQRITQVLESYREGKRGRPPGWSKQMQEALADASDHLQTVSDEQITQATSAYRAARRSRRQRSTAKQRPASGKR